MKIFPSTHNIKSVTDSHVDLDLNVPLAYIELDYSQYKIDKTLKEIASKNIKQEVIYNQSFDSPNVLFFNKYNEAVKMDNLLTRVNNKYYYRPKETIAFKPQTFNYEATIKKQIQYKIGNEYNINVACIDDGDSLDLSNRLSIGLCNPSYREIVPPNISINNNRNDAQTFTDMSISDCDFLFIDSPDGIKYEEDDFNSEPIENNKIDTDIFLSNNTSVWIGSEYNRNYPHKNEDAAINMILRNPLLNASLSVKSRYTFDISSLPYNPNIVYHNIFIGDIVPVLIIEHIGKGYEIISHIDMINNMQQYAPLIYEVMMYCYLNGYQKTKTMNQWITNEIPDYQLESGKLVKKKYFSSDISLNSYFNLSSSEMQLYSVDIMEDKESILPSSEENDLFQYSSAISFVGLSNGRLLFNKNVNKSSPYYIEPEKPIGWVSIYNGNEILYLKELHYIVETNLEDSIYMSTDENNLNVKILAFKSTSLGIDTQMPFNLTIPFIKTEVNKIERIREAEYLFYIDTENININFVFAEDFKEEMGVELFAVNIYQTNEAINVTDMRKLGGGLKEDAADNYNLMDIGHINGRPYRATNTLVFTLPTKYKEHEQLIEKAIKKYIGASEYPIIFFEDKE